MLGIDKILHFGMCAFLTAVVLFDRNYGFTDKWKYGNGIMDLWKHGNLGQVKDQELRVKYEYFCGF